MKREAYEFFSIFKAEKPIWSKNINDKKPVFIDKNRVSTPIGISITLEVGTKRTFIVKLFAMHGTQ
jgi:hypothetical protein